MSSKTPFELRFEIFEKASQMKEGEYFQLRDNAMVKYEWEKDNGKNPKTPDFPTFPSFSEISEYASRINDFVSNTK